MRPCLRACVARARSHLHPSQVNETVLTGFVSDVAAKAGIVSARWLAPLAPRAGRLDLASIACDLLGGNSEAVSTVASQFSKSNLSTDSEEAFLPLALGLLKDNISHYTKKHIKEALPGLSDFSGGLEGIVVRGLPGKIKKLFPW